MTKGIEKKHNIGLFLGQDVLPERCKGSADSSHAGSAKLGNACLRQDPLKARLGLMHTSRVSYSYYLCQISLESIRDHCSVRALIFAATARSYLATVLQELIALLYTNQML